MNRVLPLCTLAAFTLFAAHIAWSVGQGRELRRLEVQARTVLEELLQAETEHWRQQQVDGQETSRFAFLEEMVERSGRPALASLQAVQEPGSPDLFRTDGYLVRLTLLDEWGARFTHRTDENDGLRLSRFEVWVWPERAIHSSLVLYYGNNAGYVVQGENGLWWGPGAALPPNPLRDLEEDPSQAQRWSILEERGQEHGGSPAESP